MRLLRQFGVLFAREIEALYLSPIAYAVLTIGLLLNGLSFSILVKHSGGAVALAVRAFFGSSTLFWLVALLLPPLLTMRLFAEERRAGTLEMLLTAPVAELEVVLAKFFAGLCFYVSLWVPSLLYLALIKRHGAIPDAGPLATSYLGIILLGGLFTAVGVFASSLTANQILAAVLALVFNLMLFFIPSLSTVTGVPEVERFLMEMWIFHHFEDSFSKGIFDSAHVAFYVTMIGVFLFWTVRVVESQRWR